MNEHEKTDITRHEMTTYGVIVVLFLIVGFLAIYARALQDRLDNLEKSSNATIESQQAQIDGLSLNIETVRNEMSAGFESQQTQINNQAEQIATQKRNLHSTNQALTSFRKTQGQVEEELREELKKD